MVTSLWQLVFAIFLLLDPQNYNTWKKDLISLQNQLRTEAKWEELTRRRISSWICVILLFGKGMKLEVIAPESQDLFPTIQSMPAVSALFSI